MPRPERVVDPSTGPLAEFALELRKLRRESGQPSYRNLAARSSAAGGSRSHTVLSDAAGGRQLPSWETTSIYIRACGADPSEWRERWEKAQAQIRAAAVANGALPANAHVAINHLVVSDNDPGADVPGEANADTLATLSSRGNRFWAVVILGIILVLAVGTIAVLAIIHGQNSSRTAAAIVVQNEVAIGPSTLIEDSTYASLSTKPVAYCSKLGCNIPGTDMSTGALVTAICQTTGQAMSNANENSAGIDNNKAAARSSLWYGAKAPDGSLGYISEVYIRADERGGLGLPECSSL